MGNEKLSPDARQLLRAATLNHDVALGESGETDILVRTTRELSSEDRGRLESLGATVRTVAGDVLTAHIPVNQLGGLADLDLVAYVEISRPLMQERPSAAVKRTAGEET